MTIKAIAPSDKKSDMTGSYSREGVQVGGLLYCSWRGYALVKANVLSPSLDIIIPSTQREIPDTTSLIIPANSFITSVMMRNAGNLTLAAATGKLKLAPTLTNSTAVLYTESSAAAANVLASGNLARTFAAPSSFTTVGGSDVTYRIFATDGAAGASAAASTVTASVDTKVYVVVSFISHINFPANSEFLVSAP